MYENKMYPVIFTFTSDWEENIESPVYFDEHESKLHLCVSK